MSRYDVLLLDFGGVCLLNPVELHGVVEAHFGLPAGTLDWTGPLDPGRDELYRESIGSGGITEREYWDARAADVGRAAGVALDIGGYMRIAYDAPSDRLIRPEAQRVAAVARSAGIGVSVLTNDLRVFHADDWVARIEFLAEVDHLVDCSHVGFLKPDARAYAYALEVLGDVRPERILFVDDQPLNVEAAERSGMRGSWFDIANPSASWARVEAELLAP